MSNDEPRDKAWDQILALIHSNPRVDSNLLPRASAPRVCTKVVIIIINLVELF